MVRQLRNRLIITEEDTVTDVDAGKYNEVSSPVISLNFHANHGIKLECDDFTTSRDHSSPTIKVPYQTISKNIRKNGVKMEKEDNTNCTVHASQTSKVSHGAISGNIYKNGVKMEPEDSAIFKNHSSQTNEDFYQVISTKEQEKSRASGSESYENLHQIYLHNIPEAACRGIANHDNNITEACVSPFNENSHQEISSKIQKNGRNVETDNNSSTEAFSNTVNENSYPNVLQQKATSKKKRHLGFLSIGHMKTYNLRLRKELLPKMQIQHHTLSELDDFASHMMEMFDKELRLLGRKQGKVKTLGVKHIETVMKLCLPKTLLDSAVMYAKRAVDNYKISARNKK